MNVLLTTLCNRKCKYCFANGKIDYNDKGKTSYYISLENINKVINYFKHSDERNISLLGGEPTIHPDFDKIIDIVKALDIHINIFTNGLIPEKALKAIEKIDPHQLRLTVNINEPRDNTKTEWRRVTELFERIPEYIGLGFNLYQNDFDGSFLIALCTQYKLKKEIRLGLAQPVINEKNAFIHPNNYSDVGDKIVDLSDSCDKYDLSLGFDCGFVMCMFSEKQLGRLMSNNVRLQFVCGPAIDIGPDLSVWSCFPLSRIFNTHLEGFKTLKEVYNYYLEKFKFIFLNGIYNHCSECKYLLRNQCGGGCGAHIYNKSMR
jgi:radical SAM protein with 4Fe4S-binding SPASM domain